VNAERKGLSRRSMPMAFCEILLLCEKSWILRYRESCNTVRTVGPPQLVTVAVAPPSTGNIPASNEGARIVDKLPSISTFLCGQN
jgi:hypothetical protein